MTSRRAFTLVEALVVIAVIGVLLALMLPAVQKVRAASARTACQNNLRQVATAFHSYGSAHGVWPMGLSPPALRGERYPHLGWLARLLPYIEQQGLWQATVEAYAKSPKNPFELPHTGIMTPVAVYSCPADQRQRDVHDTHHNLRVAVSGYLGVLGTDYLAANGVLRRGSATRSADVADGTSSTLMAGERPPSPDFWLGWWYASDAAVGSGDTILGAREQNSGYDPYTAMCPAGPYRYKDGRVDQQCDAFHFWSLHPGGANFAFCDGSVRFLPYSADAILPALATRAGGESVQLPD